jgi:hypothetical protein
VAHGKNDLWSHNIRLQSDLKLYMQLRLAINFDLDENEDEKCIYIVHFKWLGKKR